MMPNTESMTQRRPLGMRTVAPEMAATVVAHMAPSIQGRGALK